MPIPWSSHKSRVLMVLTFRVCPLPQRTKQFTLLSPKYLWVGRFYLGDGLPVRAQSDRCKKNHTMCVVLWMAAKIRGGKDPGCVTSWLDEKGGKSQSQNKKTKTKDRVMGIVVLYSRVWPGRPHTHEGLWNPVAQRQALHPGSPRTQVRTPGPPPKKEGKEGKKETF